MKTQKTTRNHVFVGMFHMKCNFIWILINLIITGLLALASTSLAADGAWTKKANLPTARWGLSAWEEGPALPSGRFYFAIAQVEDTVYVIGGALPGVSLSAVESYDLGVPNITAIAPKGKIATKWSEIKAGK